LRDRSVPLNPPGYLATQDLKDRGWTPRLIAQFLGDNDAARPNGLKMGRRRLPPVRLYLETRVEDAEREDTFLLAQHRAMQARERAEEARARRAEERTAYLDAAAERFRPTIEPLPLRKGAVRKAREPYLTTMTALIGAVKHELTQPPEGKKPTRKPQPLTEAEEKDFLAVLQRRLDTALALAYAWFPDPAEAEAKKAGKGKPGRTAKADDWRKWEWD
jgi:hypothetical protein